VEFMDKIVAGCTVNETSAQVYSCKNKEDNELREWVRKDGPTDLYDTLSELALDKDAKKSGAAIGMADSLFSTRDDAWKEKNATKGATARFLEVVKANDGLRAGKAATIASHFSMIRGKEKRLFKVIEDHKDDKVRAQAYQAYMTFGRLNGFKELERVTKKSKKKEYITAALKAPRNMYKDTDKEKDAYCPWAKGFLGDKDLDIASAAGLVLVKCKGKYIDTLIDEGEKRVKAGEFKRPLSQVYREPCFEFIKDVTKKAARDKQCDRLYTFLQAVADNEKVESGVRGQSLWNIYYQRRDQKTLDLMRKYENHKDPEVQKNAKDAIKSLTTSYKLK